MYHPILYILLHPPERSCHYTTENTSQEDIDIWLAVPLSTSTFPPRDSES